MPLQLNATTSPAKIHDNCAEPKLQDTPPNCCDSNTAATAACRAQQQSQQLPSNMWTSEQTKQENAAHLRNRANLNYCRLAHIYCCVHDAMH
jgi:hypothetical protein